MFIFLSQKPILCTFHKIANDLRVVDIGVWRDDMKIVVPFPLLKNRTQTHFKNSCLITFTLKKQECVSLTFSLVVLNQYVSYILFLWLSQINVSNTQCYRNIDYYFKNHEEDSLSSYFHVLFLSFFSFLTSQYHWQGY